MDRLLIKYDEKYNNAGIPWKQVKIKLPDTIKPDILVMLIDYIDKGKELPNEIDIYVASNLVIIADALKMR